MRNINQHLFKLAAVCAALVSSHVMAAIPIQRWVQPSGAQVYLVESQTLPMVDVRLEFDAGSRRESADKAGLTNIAAAMTSKGVEAKDGRPALDENQLSEAWADLGASFGGSAGSDRMSFTMRTLTYPDVMAKSIDLASRQLGEPAFPDEIWQRERQRISAAIREANTKPATQASRAFSAAVYGTHPYGYETTEATLARIATADMRDVYKLVQPCRAKVSIVGAVTRAQADAMVTSLMARLPAASRCDALPAVAEVQPLAAPVTRNIPFASAQAHVLIGQPGYKRNDPDYFPLVVGNYILGGGGLVSRLSDEVREKRGLSYSVYTYFQPGLHAGAFTLGLQTRPDQAAQAVKVAQETLAGFVAKGPTAEELKAARDYLVGGFPLLIDSNRKLLDNVANIAWFDLPLDYLDTWTAKVQAVTAAQIKSAFERKVSPDKLVVVVVGAAR